MDGRSRKASKRIRIQREFECSRLEQSMLAEAYRKVLPNAVLKFVERTDCEIEHGQSDAQTVLPDNESSLVNHAMATGGPQV